MVSVRPSVCPVFFHNADMINQHSPASQPAYISADPSDSRYIALLTFDRSVTVATDK